MSIKKKEIIKKLNEFFSLIKLSIISVFFIELALILSIGTRILKNTNLTSYDPLMSLWTFYVVYFLGIFLLLYGTTTLRQINLYTTLASLMLILIPFQDRPLFIVKSALILFSVGYVFEILKIVFRSKFFDLINKKIKRGLKKTNRRIIK